MSIKLFLILISYSIFSLTVGKEHKVSKKVTDLFNSGQHEEADVVDAQIRYYATHCVPYMVNLISANQHNLGRGKEQMKNGQKEIKDQNSKESLKKDKSNGESSQHSWKIDESSFKDMADSKDSPRKIKQSRKRKSPSSTLSRKKECAETSVKKKFSEYQSLQLTDEDRQLMYQSIDLTCPVYGKLIDYIVIKIIDKKKKFQSEDVYVYVPTDIVTLVISDEKLIENSEWNFMTFKDKVLVMPFQDLNHWSVFNLYTKSKIALYFDGDCPGMERPLHYITKVLKDLLTALENRNYTRSDDMVDTKNWTLIQEKPFVRSARTQTHCAVRCIKFIDGVINHGTFLTNESTANYRKILQNSILDHKKKGDLNFD